LLSQRSILVAWFRDQRHVTPLLILILVCSTGIGCASARPPRWPSRVREKNVAVDPAPAVGEPAVVANVATTVEASNESSTESASTSRTSSGRSGKKLGRLDRSFDSGLLDPDHANDSDSDPLTELQKSNSSMERLHAALSDDSLQESELTQGSLTTLDQRVRVESLLARAKQLIELGQLEQARQTAQMAQDVVEAAQLDYSPDEERPIDLVRSIDGQLEALRLTDLQAGEEAPRAPNDGTETDATVSNAAKVEGKETKGLARFRRDFSTLFRREKKPVNKEPEQAVAEQVASAPTPVAPSTQSNPNSSKSVTGRKIASSVASPISSEAVVMANRSVSLGSDESVTPSSVSFDPDIGTGSSGKVSSVTTDSIKSREFDTPLSDVAPDSNQGTNDRAHELDEPNMVPPDFDVVDPVRPRHELSATIDEQPIVKVVESDDERRTDWTTFYLAVAGCSLLAFACYRRGAT